MDARSASDKAWSRDDPRSYAGGPKPNGRDPDWREIRLVRYADLGVNVNSRPLIRGILEHGQTSLLVGKSGSGKTFLALDLALHVAAGTAWLGHHVDQGRVVYVAAEAGMSIGNRIAAWRGHHSLTALPFSAVVQAIDLCHPKTGDIDRLIAAIGCDEEERPALLVIDTISRVLAGGNENAPDDMGALVKSIDRLRDEIGCHVLAVHHLGKDQSRGARGHNLLHCAVDTEIEVVRDAATKIATATITKQRDGETGLPIMFRLHPVILGTDADGETITSCVVETARGTPSKAKRPLTGAALIELNQLRNCMAQSVTDIPSSTHVPNGAKGVLVQLWKDYLIQAKTINEDGNPREEFKRIYVTLQERGYIGIWGDYVWMVT